MRITGRSPLVSIIIPVYDIEAYVADAIRSVMAQTLDDWELICIDDESHDGSLQVCQRLAAADERISVVSRPHAGPGAVRNYGATLARGTYVYFLDGDDMIVPDALERCVQAAERDGLDMVLFGAQVMVEDGAWHNERFYMRSQAYSGVWDGASLYVAQRAAGDYRAQACLYLTRLELVRGMGDVFAPGVIHEDESGTYRLLMRARRVACQPDLLYCRRYRPGSIMTSRDWPASVRGYYAAYAAAYAEEPAVDEVVRAEARRLQLDAQATSFIRAVYHCGVPLRQLPALVGAQDGDPALASLMARPELDPRSFVLRRTLLRVRGRLSRLKRRAIAAWRRVSGRPSGGDSDAGDAGDAHDGSGASS